MDVFVFFLLSHLKVQIIEEQAKPVAAELAHAFVISFLNVLILLITFVAMIILMPVESYDPMSPDIAESVIIKVNHSCKAFQHLVRTSYFLDLNIQSFQKIEGIGKYIYPILFFASLSLLPFVAITMSFRAAIDDRLNQSIKSNFQKKVKEKNDEQKDDNNN